MSAMPPVQTREQDPEACCFWGDGFETTCVPAEIALQDPAIAAYALEMIERNEGHAKAFGQSGAIYSNAAKERLRQVASQPQPAAKADFSDIAVGIGGVLGGIGGYKFVGRTRSTNHATTTKALEVLQHNEAALSKEWGELNREKLLRRDLAELKEGKDSSAAIKEQEARAKAAKMEKNYASKAGRTGRALNNVKSTPPSGMIGRTKQLVGGVIGAVGGAAVVKVTTTAGKLLVKTVPGVGWALTANDVYEVMDSATEPVPRNDAAIEKEKRGEMLRKLKVRRDR